MTEAGSLLFLTPEGRDFLREAIVTLCVSLDMVPSDIWAGAKFVKLTFRPGDGGRFVKALHNRRKGLGYIYEPAKHELLVFPLQNQEHAE